MSFLERKDNQWLNVAVDPETRAQRIVTLASNRLYLIWALVMSGVGYAVAMIGQISGRSSGGIGFGVIFLAIWFSFAEIQHELRLLKLIVRMQPRQELEFQPSSSSVE